MPQRGAGWVSESYWGFSADWDALPDLHEVVESIDDELGRLRG